MKHYLIINPFTLKPIKFSTFIQADEVSNVVTGENGETIVVSAPALCIETDYDPALLGKTYEPLSQTFID